MTNIHRLSGLILLAVLAAGMLMRPRAEAEFAGATPLGPASELVLEGAGDKNITLKVDDANLAWGAAPTHRIYSEAYVSIGDLLDPLMATDSFVDERKQLTSRLQDDERKLAEAIEGVRTQIDGLAPDDPARPALAEEGRRLLQQRQAFLQLAQTTQSNLAGEQLERAYRELVEAVKIVAESKQIDLVHRFIPTDDDFNGTSAPDALNEIRMRNLLVYPDDLDLTAEVADELGVELDGK